MDRDSDSEEENSNGKSKFVLDSDDDIEVSDAEEAAMEQESKPSVTAAATTTSSTTSTSTPTRKVTFRHDGGVRELVDVLCTGKSPLLVPSTDGGSGSGAAATKEVPTLFIDKEVATTASTTPVQVQVALRWSRDSYHAEALQGFANGIRTQDGGSHLDGFKAAVSKTVNSFARKVSVCLMLKLQPICTSLWTTVCYRNSDLA